MDEDDEFEAELRATAAQNPMRKAISLEDILNEDVCARQQHDWGLSDVFLSVRQQL